MTENKKTGKLYGVGIGPGDPELLTRKAVRILHTADVIAAPYAEGRSQTALIIVREFIHGKPLLRCPAPMTRDHGALDAVWQQNTAQVCSLLEKGKTVAFVTLGDPTIYSTYMYLHRRVLEQGYAAELVPGVPSFCAAAAALNCSLCEGEERLLIVPSSHGNLQDSLDVKANKVLMKAGHQLGALQETLRQRGELDRAALVVNCGMPGERIVPSFAEAETDAGYFSLVIVKEKNS